MAGPRVVHTKVSTVADGADTDAVRPSDWNADHTLVNVPGLDIANEFLAEQSITISSSAAGLSISQNGSGDILVLNGASGKMSVTVTNGGQVQLRAHTMPNVNPTGISSIGTGRAANTGGFVNTYAVLNTAADYVGSSLTMFQASQGTLLGAAPANQYGFFCGNLSGGTVNTQYYAAGSASFGNYSFYAVGKEAYFGGQVTINGGMSKTPTRSTVAAGSTIVLTNSTTVLLYDNASTAASLTVTLPSTNLRDGQHIEICTRSAITALTVNGGTIYNAPTTLAAGAGATFVYSSAAGAWFRR